MRRITSKKLICSAFVIIASIGRFMISQILTKKEKSLLCTTKILEKIEAFSIVKSLVIPSKFNEELTTEN